MVKTVQQFIDLTAARDKKWVTDEELGMLRENLVHQYPHTFICPAEAVPIISTAAPATFNGSTAAPAEALAKDAPVRLPLFKEPVQTLWVGSDNPKLEIRGLYTKLPGPKLNGRCVYGQTSNTRSNKGRYVIFTMPTGKWVFDTYAEYVAVRNKMPKNNTRPVAWPTCEYSNGAGPVDFLLGASSNTLLHRRWSTDISKMSGKYCSLLVLDTNLVCRLQLLGPKTSGSRTGKAGNPYYSASTKFTLINGWPVWYGNNGIYSLRRTDSRQWIMGAKDDHEEGWLYKPKKTDQWPTDMEKDNRWHDFVKSTDPWVECTSLFADARPFRFARVGGQDAELSEALQGAVFTPQQALVMGRAVYTSPDSKLVVVDAFLSSHHINRSVLDQFGTLLASGQGLASTIGQTTLCSAKAGGLLLRPDFV
jgi:hypothetical protein